MNLPRLIANRLRALFRKNQLDRDLAEEMRMHLEMEVERNRASGLSPDEALYAARLQFGGVAQIQELARDQRGWRWVEQTGNDFHFAEALKEGAGALGDSRRLRLLRGAFVVVQSALAVALLVGAGLMIRTVSRLQQIDLGFKPAHKFVLMGSRSGVVDRDRLEPLNTAILERLSAHFRSWPTRSRDAVTNSA